MSSAECLGFRHGVMQPMSLKLQNNQRGGSERFCSTTLCCSTSATHCAVALALHTAHLPHTLFCSISASYCTVAAHTVL